MVDITHKTTSLREATVEAIVKTSSSETILAIKEHRVPKGNVLEIARAAGLFAVKKTPDVIPDCHPLPVEYTRIDYVLKEDKIVITLSAKCIYRTGIEVEAMHGASVVALTMYDMLKPIDKGIQIQNIRLVEKTGGKSGFKNKYKDSVTAAIVTTSNSISNGTKENKVSPIIQAKLDQYKIPVAESCVIPDDVELIQNKLQQLAEQGVRLVIFAGGTGLTKTDATPEALLPLLEKRLTGIEEAMHSFGQERTALSMISRSFAGTYKSSLVLGIPGSSNGAKDSIDAIFPGVLHCFKTFK